jgi:outer membrane protein OmpA-like peptidoglycan-associated protein
MPFKMLFNRTRFKRPFVSRDVSSDQDDQAKRRSLVYIGVAGIVVLGVALLFFKTSPPPEVTSETAHQQAGTQPQFVPPVRPHLNPHANSKSNSQPAPQADIQPKADKQLNQALAQAKGAEDSAKTISGAINPVGAALQPGSDTALPARIAVSDLHFESGTATLTDDSSATLDQLASDLKTHPSATVRLEGYTDNTGSSQDNQKLSFARATSIRNGLINRGVNPSQLRATGMGGTNPVASNITQMGRDENRRTDIVVVSR